MQLVHLPLLHVQREIYALPRGRARFQAYIARMTGPDGDLRLPLTAMNPMAHDHVAHSVDGWLAIGAEDAAARALEEAASDAAATGGEARLQVGLVVADDVRGGWTNRYTTDFGSRFESQPFLRRGFAVALLWASELPDLQVARREALRACGRAIWQTTRGFGRSVRELLAQEQFALRLAGETPKPLPDARFLEATDPATVFAVLYGDDGATALGHPPLGLAPALE
ncbi:MAG TPA: hypothetical protein VGH20_08190 [Myxococcales bacterium]|jgi:hypothetical protein